MFFRQAGTKLLRLAFQKFCCSHRLLSDIPSRVEFLSRNSSLAEPTAANIPLMPHLPASKFAHVFEPLQGMAIGFVRPQGNVGDLLIEQATRQLFTHYKIGWRYWSPGQPLGDLQHLVFGGGGNMGTTYRSNWELRGACLESGLPVTIFPQSFLGDEQRTFHRVYVRETASLRFAPNAILAPDLALGLNPGKAFPAQHRLGIFLRKDQEAGEKQPWFSVDPIKLARTPDQYLRFAAQYETLITNRLHLAVCGILMDRNVILLPNSYHKNASLHETWLADLGCQFADSLEAALSQAGIKQLSRGWQWQHYLSASYRKLWTKLNLPLA